MKIEGLYLEGRKQGMNLNPGIQQIMPVTLICAVPAVSAAILMIDETDRFNTVNLYCKLNIFQHHFIIMYRTRQ